MVFLRSQPPHRSLCFLITVIKEVKLQKRCDRNRKRSKPRPIFCPIHGCYITSASQKHYLFADTPEQLSARGIPKLASSLLINSHTTIAISGEWLEAFWCDQCQEVVWYHVCKKDDRLYEVFVAPQHLWQKVSGVIDPKGNPSVGEFTRRQARLNTFNGSKGFNFI
jgi:hypothetical protein